MSSVETAVHGLSCTKMLDDATLCDVRPPHSVEYNFFFHLDILQVLQKRVPAHQSMQLPLYTTWVELLDLVGEGLCSDCFKWKGRALSGEHMKGQLCHLGALMTD